MANVLQIQAIPELEKLNELAESLDGILSCIAYDGKAVDRQYILDAQRRVKKQYAHIIDRIKMGPLIEQSDCGLSNAVHNILCAYDGLQYILDAADIEQEAADLLHEHLLLPEPEDAAQCGFLL